MKVSALFRWVYFGILVIGFSGAMSGCRSATPQAAAVLPKWDVDRAEAITWQSDDPNFEQNFALEASGLAASEEYLYVSSEKYSRLLLVETIADFRARVVPLDVPRHAELEGITLAREGLLLCDEAHAAVYRIEVPNGLKQLEAGRGETSSAEKLSMDGVAVQGGKIGFEGIEINPTDGMVYLLLERSGNETDGCVSRIYRLQPENDRLLSRLEPLEIELEDCAWRLTGLAWWKGTLLALKTQFPGERYEVVTIDLASGETDVVLEMTALLRRLETEGWSNNVEGIAVAPDGSLWLVADNAVTGVIDDPVPPTTDHRTLLLRLPVSVD